MTGGLPSGVARPRDAEQGADDRLHARLDAGVGERHGARRARCGRSARRRENRASSPAWRSPSARSRLRASCSRRRCEAGRRAPRTWRRLWAARRDSGKAPRAIHPQNISGPHRSPNRSPLAADSRSSPGLRERRVERHLLQARASRAETRLSARQVAIVAEQEEVPGATSSFLR